MGLIAHIAESMLLLVLLFAAAIALRTTGAVKEQDSRVLARVVTLLVLPAMVFNHLSQHRVRAEMLEAPALLLASALLLLAVGWLAGKWLFRLDRPQHGALILCTGFASVTFLGIPLVAIVYPTLDLEETVLIAEFGSSVPVFVLGPMIAAYYGGGADFSVRRALLEYLRSPIFIAIAGGLLWGNLGLPRGGNLPLDTLFLTLDHLEGALLPLVALTVGLMLKPMPIRRVAALVAFVAVCQLAVEPLLLAGGSALLQLPERQAQALILLGATPVATLPAIFCREYGCDAELAAGLILVTTVLSLATIPVVVATLG